MSNVEREVRATADFKEWTELREVCESFLKQGIFTGEDKKLSWSEKDIVEQEERIMLDIWDEYKFLPVEMANSVLGEARNDEIVPRQSKVEPLVRFSALPRTRLKYIRNAAEKLSFAIIPYEYINQEGIVAKYAEDGQAEYAETIRAGFEDVSQLYESVNAFEEIEVYILCPVGFYDPWQEVTDERTRQKMFGGELSSVAMILGMLMPTQKNLFQMTKANAENIEQLNGTMEMNFAQVKKTLDDVQSQISWLSELAVSAERKANQALGASRTALKTARRVEYKLQCLLDPLIFAVPRGTDLDDDADARLLMCFGADMPLDFFLRRGLTRVDSNGYYNLIVKVYK